MAAFRRVGAFYSSYTIVVVIRELPKVDRAIIVGDRRWPRWTGDDGRMHLPGHTTIFVYDVQQLRRHVARLLIVRSAYGLNPSVVNPPPLHRRRPSCGRLGKVARQLILLEPPPSVYANNNRNNNDNLSKLLPFGRRQRHARFAAAFPL